ncbi:hypothetical protein [Agrococcus sp. TSP3-2-1]|uniref:hypothetical protein n=1 Tax=Agrococcus sp. TSP3-2-1 TaxID=2804583 RepID=UPI003CFA083E
MMAIFDMNRLLEGDRRRVLRRSELLSREIRSRTVNATTSNPNYSRMLDRWCEGRLDERIAAAKR